MAYLQRVPQGSVLGPLLLVKQQVANVPAHLTRVTFPFLGKGAKDADKTGMRDPCLEACLGLCSLPPSPPFLCEKKRQEKVVQTTTVMLLRSAELSLSPEQTRSYLMNGG